MTNRFFAFFGQNQASVAMDIKDLDGDSSELTFALAFCKDIDSFRKDVARNILNGRLDALLDPEHKKPVRLTFQTIYRGDYPKRDVMNTVMDELRTIGRGREREDIVDVLENIEEDLEQVALKGLHEVAHLR
jgi:hypothetical protein